MTATNRTPGPPAAHACCCEEVCECESPFADATEHLAAELKRLSRIVVGAVEGTRRPNGGKAPSGFPGLVISDAEVDALLEAGRFPGAGWSPLSAARGRDGEVDADRARIDVRRRATASELPLERIASAFRLSPAEVDVLLLALAPEVDPAFETLYAYLHNDATRRRPSVQLAVELIARTPGERVQVRRLLSAEGTLMKRRLIATGEEPFERTSSWPKRSLRVDDGVANYLLGGAGPLVPGGEWTRPKGDAVGLEIARESLAELKRIVPRWNSSGASWSMLWFDGEDPEPLRAAADALAAANDRGVLRASMAALRRHPARLATMARDAMMWNGVIVLEATEDDPARGEHEAVQSPNGEEGEPLSEWPMLRELGTCVILCGPSAAVGGAAVGIPLWRLTVEPPHFPARRRAWEVALSDAGLTASAPDLDTLADAFRFGMSSARVATARARGLAVAKGRDAPGLKDLMEASRGLTPSRLHRLANRIDPRYDWDDLILPERKGRQLRDLAARLRLRRRVLSEWGFGRKHARGQGLLLLFTGASGTGKTMAAEVLAGALGRPLFQVDLSCVVSKYIGETEKNLRAVFREADRCGAVLFFDEADALFGKRTEVKDAHDRYANIEVNYLLQGIERYEGVVILATNLQKNVDDAFLRRIHEVVDFAFPDECLRERIWRSHFPTDAPRVDGLDFGFLARQLEFSGGSIKTVVLNAAFHAASESTAIGMEHILRAARRELEKQGRLAMRSDFGAYAHLVPDGSD